MRVLVTGAAGFIGFHVARALLARGDAVVGFDVVNDYYDPALKEARLVELEAAAGAAGAWSFLRADIADRAAVDAAFAGHGPFDRVIHLAAQAGVRHSLEHPVDYVQSNLLGFTHILEACRRGGVGQLTYASTSSVYGANATMPFTEGQGVDHPLQFYAATKRANELMAHAYSHLYRLPTTGLRFFTVYGPWGRPDMALFLFTKAILEGRPIDVFNHGRMQRDFTYVDDIVAAVVRVCDRPPSADETFDATQPDPATSNAPYRVFNIGNHQPVPLMEFIACLERQLGRPAEKRLLPMQPGDVPATYADTSALSRWIDFSPNTPLDEGIARFVQWYLDYYRI